MARQPGAREGEKVSEVKWLPEALADAARLHASLRDIGPKAAARAAAAIRKGSEALQSLPRLGRPMDDDTGRRDWFIPFGAGAYVLRYMLEDGTPVIIRVWHCRENWLGNTEL
jgi:plasmid stabilization system protein ParE